MSNRKVIAMIGAADERARAERVAIGLEWLKAIREFRGKIEELQARIELLEAERSPLING